VLIAAGQRRTPAYMQPVVDSPSQMAALELSHDREVEYGAAFALALAGDSARSKALADDLEKRFPEGTALRFNYLPALRGHLALERGNPARAKKLLEIAVP
jgi:hypothetical protein